MSHQKASKVVIGLSVHTLEAHFTLSITPSGPFSPQSVIIADLWYRVRTKQKLIRKARRHLSRLGFGLGMRRTISGGPAQYALFKSS